MIIIAVKNRLGALHCEKQAYFPNFLRVL